ncbi:MAG TPA: hypothetical protein VL461_08460 [Dictyobacter sp.]|jgi:hypothetical protein|nr:hypothetical protein [Dictyobacter sp.]
MQQVQQRELPERISWARAVIFAVGFFFIAAILLGQLPGDVYNLMTASSLEGFEQLMFALGVICLGCFAVIVTILLLFDPKPVVSPAVVAVTGGIVFIVGLLIALVSTMTGNEYFPNANTNLFPLLGGKFLWFQPNDMNFLTLGLMILGVGLAMVFYSVLAIGEQKNPDRRDLGTTPGMRLMLTLSILFLIVFVVGYTYIPSANVPGSPVYALFCVLLGAAVLLGFGTFALRLHYLMRPARKNTMSGLYAIGAIGLAQTGAIALLAWFFAYPLLTWMQSWSFIGLGSFLSICTKYNAIPASCSFSPDAGYIVDAIITTNFLILMLAAVVIWKSKRNLVVVGGIVTIAAIAVTAFLVHTDPTQLPTAMMLATAILVLAAILTSVARREFAVVGENNLGCIGMLLMTGVCLFIYLAAFAFFSIPQFGESETPPNIPYAPGAGGDAFIMVIICALLAGLQFYFLVRNRYRV